MTGISLTKVSLVQRIRVNTSRRPSVKLTTRNSAVPSTLWASVARSTPPWSARPKMIAMMVQPIVSSMMAEATITCPRLRRMKRISRTTMATILTEEIDSAVPRKSEVIRRRSGRGSIASGRNSPSAKPQANGTAIPVAETLNAARPAFRTRDRSVSMPVRSSSMRMPSWETAPIMLLCSPLAGKIACWASGQSAPSTDGPSRRPASSCPMTAGCPIRCMTSPMRRPTESRRMICTRKTTSEGPVFSASAARTGAAARSASASAAAEPSVSCRECAGSRVRPGSGRLGATLRSCRTRIRRRSWAQRIATSRHRSVPSSRGTGGASGCSL